jgi:hypothetical protein
MHAKKMDFLGAEFIYFLASSLVCAMACVCVCQLIKC